MSCYSLQFPSSSPHCSLCLSLLKMMFCQFNSHYSNVFINIYGASSDREEGEECGGGQQRLSIPTSQVMKIIQCNNWIAIFFYAQHKKWLKRPGDGRRQWGLSRLSHFLLIGLISKLKSETVWACHSSIVLSDCHGHVSKIKYLL